MMNSKLAIAIPTYNRPEVLKENLELMLPEISKYDIPLYISDDSDNLLTKDAIVEIKKKYDHIFYKKNEPNLGHDFNCISTLNMPSSEYIWYLGDSKIIKTGAIEQILNIINSKNYDFILVSEGGRGSRIQSKEYLNYNLFFKDLAWHATMTGVTIYRKDVLFRSNYETYYNTNFVQLGIILEEMVNLRYGLLWINDNLVCSNQNKTESYWNDSIFSVFAEDWSNFILSLSEKYTNENKYKVIKSHSDNTGIFKMRNYLRLRKNGTLNLNTYFKYFKYIKLSSSLNIYIVFLVAIIPRLIPNMMIKLNNYIKMKKFN